MPRYHHLTSDYARLTDDAIDAVLEAVRDANEVLLAVDGLPAADMILAALGVCEAELLFDRHPGFLAESGEERRHDWTLACMAQAHTVAVLKLRQRGANEAAERASATMVGLLRKLANSPFRSPLLNYTSILSELIDCYRSHDARPRIALCQHYLAEELQSPRSVNVLRVLHDIGEVRLQLGEADRAFDLFTQLLRFDPTELWTHVRLAHTLTRDFPEIALAAAERAILLLPREDNDALRRQLRSAVEQTRDRQALALPPLARSLLTELRAKPGKRSRGSLRTLCMGLEPEIAYAPTKQAEPLPDVAALAQLRRELQTLPRPMPVLPEDPARTTTPSDTAKPAQVGTRTVSRIPPPSAATPAKKVGRNDPCPCGSGTKYKRCCAGRQR